MNQYHVQVVVAGVVVTKALFWTSIVTVFGFSVTDFGPGCYDHLNYNHLSAVLNELDSNPDKTKVVVAEVVIAKLVFSCVFEKRSWLNASS